MAAVADTYFSVHRRACGSLTLCHRILVGNNVVIDIAGKGVAGEGLRRNGEAHYALRGTIGKVQFQTFSSCRSAVLCQWCRYVHHSDLLFVGKLRDECSPAARCVHGVQTGGAVAACRCPIQRVGRLVECCALIAALRRCDTRCTHRGERSRCLVDAVECSVVEYAIEQAFLVSTHRHEIFLVQRNNCRRTLGRSQVNCSKLIATVVGIAEAAIYG